MQSKFKLLLKSGLRFGTYSLLSVSLFSCAMNPHNVDVALPESKPQVKITSYSEALRNLGLMTDIYDPGSLNIQSQDIRDNTGASRSTGSEIQRNITEIMKSTLNSIGGQVTFIEYDPAYIHNQMNNGYSSFDNKLIPDVVITGGITEFDRGLETRSEGTNFDAEFQATGLPKWVPGDSVGLGIGDNEKAGKARITLDFNMKDFQTLAGIPQMTTTNSMEVFKGLHEKELGITFFGPTFGMKGSSKKVQGRHEAVRLLVQLSMIQMVGKYLNVPYWRLLGEDAQADPLVMNNIANYYYSLTNNIQRIFYAQQWLILHGYDIELTGQLDQPTRNALRDFGNLYQEGSQTISEELFSAIYLTIPISPATVGRRYRVNQMVAEIFAEPDIQPKKQPAPAVVEQEVAETTVEPSKKTIVTEKVSTQAKKTVKKEKVVKRKGVGRKLSESDW